MKLGVLQPIKLSDVVGDKGCDSKRSAKSRKIDCHVCVFGVRIGILELVGSVPFALSERFRWPENIEHVGREVARQRLKIGIPTDGNTPFDGTIRSVVAY
jgi:hypothetical protein